MKKYLFYIFIFSWLIMCYADSNDTDFAFQAIEQWKKTWEKQDIDSYINNYAESFFSQTSNMNYSAWLNHKKRIFSSNQPISIVLSSITLKIENNQLIVDMTQDYQAGNYQDYGKKAMIWAMIDDNWKIINEEWYALERPPADLQIKPPIEIEIPKPDTIQVKWEMKEGLVPFEYINFLFPQEQVYDEYLLIVEKKDQQAALYKFQDNFQKIDLLKSYHISSGQIPGNKYKRNDLKTPEGLYKTLNFIPDEKLPAKYGSGAYVLDYPNELDKVLKKTGSGIWIHGSDIEMVSFDTEGCIRFDNHEITNFHDNLNFNSVPIIINDELRWVTISELETEIKMIQEFLNSWLESWRIQDIQAYLSHYANDFKTYRQKMDATQWTNHKTRIFNPQKPVQIDLLNIEYYYADNLFLATFIQDYKAESLKSYGKKQLVMQKQKDRYIIIQEEWIATRQMIVNN